MIHAIIYTVVCIVMAVAGSIAHGEPIPVVLVHGIMAGSKDMSVLKGYIEEAIPGVYVHATDVGCGKGCSLRSMESQGDKLALEIMKDPQLANGFIMIAHSQGTLLARYYIENYNIPQVHTFVSLAGPNRGVYGIPGTFDERFRFVNSFERIARFLLYWSFIQKRCGVAGYWNDPDHHELYLKKCLFLPYLNNEIDHGLSNFFKANICKLHNFILVESIFDTVIEPVTSCHFGFYKYGTRTILQDMYGWDVYKEDKLGLKTLDESSRLHLLWDNSSHQDMPESKDNFEKNILPYIKVQVVDQEIPVIALNPS